MNTPESRQGATDLVRDAEEFIYIISHDLRNSMRALLEVPQWIAEDLVADGHKIEGALAENLDLLDTHTKRLDRMLHDLLIHSRIGRMQEKRAIDLATVVETVCADVKVPTDIRLELALEIPVLEMGEGDLVTLLTALFSNAVRHRDSATRCIRFGSRAERDTIVLDFQDDRPGIAPEFRERIFMAMTTLKSRDDVEGSGMGLAHVRKILGIYGGVLEWADRPDGRGVGFKLIFPNRSAANFQRN